MITYLLHVYSFDKVSTAHIPLCNLSISQSQHERRNATSQVKQVQDFSRTSRLFVSHIEMLLVAYLSFLHELVPCCTSKPNPRKHILLKGGGS